MTWFRVPRAEFDRIRKMAAEKKAKREEKRKALPWGAENTEPAPAHGVKPRRPRRKKSAVEIAWDRNDALWSEAVRRRDARLHGQLCRICGRSRALVGYHIVPKKRGVGIRWLLENGVAGCSPCNGGERWNPGLYRDKHIAILGKAHVEALEARARERAQFRLEDLLAIGAWLKAVIEAGAGRPPQPPSCLPPVVST